MAKFFNKEYFDLLQSYSGIKKDDQDETHIAVYTELQKAGELTAEWAKLVQINLYPNGEIRKKNQPTDQWHKRFKHYTWVRIYPTKGRNLDLAITVGIDANLGFVTKIDTVNQDGTSLRTKYEEIRGEFDTNSPIVSILSIEEGISKTIEELAEWSINSINNFQYTYDEVCKKIGLTNNQVTNADLNSDDESYNPSKENSKSKYPLNQILYGPAGTGKTYHTINYALAILDCHSIKQEQTEDARKNFKKYLDSGRIKFVTFHQSYGYEEFVEGIKVKEKNGQITYSVEPGIFKQICESARKNPKENYVLIIDEINRGNISKIFGELITLIEDSKRAGKTEALSVILPYSPEKSFSVPSNLYIIGTMNSSDRSLTSLDLALRRRFEFIEMLPDPKVLKDITIGNISVKELLEIINKRIKALLDQDHCIGHANFTHLTSNSTVQDLMAVFEKKIIPLLQEYFFDDWEKINLVLGGNRMIIKDEIKKELFLGMMDENQIERLNSRSWIVNKELFKGKEDQITALKTIVSPQSKTNGDSA